MTFHVTVRATYEGDFDIDATTRAEAEQEALRLVQRAGTLSDYDVIAKGGCDDE